MELLRQWLLGITGTTLILAMADTMIPSGVVKQSSKLICGLLLLIMLINPIIQLSPESLSKIALELQDTLEDEEKNMEHYYNNQIKTLIESNLQAYIVDKAMEKGISCSPRVLCSLNDDGIFIPVSVDLGELDVESFSVLKTIIAEDFGLDTTHIHGKEVLHENLEHPNHQ